MELLLIYSDDVTTRERDCQLVKRTNNTNTKDINNSNSNNNYFNKSYFKKRDKKIRKSIISREKVYVA